jgi:tetratricopeptide (TPR) repeat protein
MDDLLQVFSCVIALAMAIPLWLYFSVFCHEHGHLICGKLVGMNPCLIKVGSGSHVSVKWLFNSKLVLGLYPTGGITYVFHSNIDWKKFHITKAKILIYTAGGCLANLMLLALLILIYAYSHLPILAVFMFIEILTIAYTILPGEGILYGNKFSNDGKLFIDTFFRDYKKDYENVFTNLTKNLSRYTNGSVKLQPIFNKSLSSLQLFLEADLAISERDFGRAIDLISQLLDLSEMPDLESVYLLDILISIVINHGQMQYLKKAEIWSKKAIELASDSKTIQGSRGGILVELGQFIEAKRILLPLIEPENEPIDQGISLCYLAKADYLLGNTEKAKDFLNQANEMMNENATLSQVFLRIEQELKGKR